LETHDGAVCSVRCPPYSYGVNSDELQFIDRERIKEAHEREPQCLDDDPLICGADVSSGGAAWNVAAFRRGGDAQSIPRSRIPGDQTRELISWGAAPASFRYRRLNLAAFGGRRATGVPHLSGGLRTPRVCSMLTRRWHQQTCFLTAAESYKTGQH
jgi:hypothetical protein